MGLTKPIEQKENIKFYIKEVVSKRYYTRGCKMKNKRIYKKLLMLFMTAIILTGCATKTDVEETTVEETVTEIEVESEYDIESTEEETGTTESEELETTTEVPDVSEVSKDETKEVVPLPVFEENEYTRSFKEENLEIANLVYEQDEYESKRAFTCQVDMDLDGKVETFVMIPQYEGLYSNNGKDVYIAGDLWLIESNGGMHKLFDDADLFPMVYLYETKDTVFVVVNSSPAFVNERGFIVAYRNGEIAVRDDFTGYIAVKENREMIMWAEGYLGSCEAFEGEESQEEDRIWLGHTWTPYYFYYSEEQQDIVQYQAIEISKELAEQMAKLDTTVFQDADEVQYIYVENGYLEINGAEKKYDEDGKLKAIYFTNYEFKLNAESKTWDFADERMGIYCLDYHEDIAWDVLNEPMN